VAVELTSTTRLLAGGGAEAAAASARVAHVLDGDCSSQVTPYTSHFKNLTRHTQHVTRHTSRITRHTSHVTHHTSHNASHLFCCLFPSPLGPMQSLSPSHHLDHITSIISGKTGCFGALRISVTVSCGILGWRVCSRDVSRDVSQRPFCPAGFYDCLRGVTCDV
jgi:hypothetical protein